MGEGRLYAMIFGQPSAEDGERRSGAASRSA
jgi:hypothetical protein